MLSLKKCCIASAVCGIYASAFTQTVSQAWAVSKDVYFDQDEAVAIAVDGSGNVYVTGFATYNSTDTDYYTIKYNSIGTQQWAVAYDSDYHKIDKPTAIAVDGDYVYVTGYSQVSTNDYDYMTLVYDANNSSTVYEKRYNRSGGNDRATDLMVKDSSFYVVGTSYNSSSGSDITTIKYAISDGSQTWITHYNSGSNQEDKGSRIKLRVSSGIVTLYVTGSANTDAFNSDVVTIKYNDSGTQQWATTYTDTSGYAFPTAMTMDGSGNIYVGGGINNFPEFDYLTIKYNNSGTQLWVSTYNGTGDEDDILRGIAVDSGGNVFVTGSSNGDNDNFDWVTIKYNSSGSQQWLVRDAGATYGEDVPYAITLDSSDNVYVTGEFTSASYYTDYRTAKYCNLYGDQLWEAFYPTTTDSPYDSSRTITVSGTNVYITGKSDSDFGTVKYTQSGVPVCNNANRPLP